MYRMKHISPEAPTAGSSSKKRDLEEADREKNRAKPLLRLFSQKKRRLPRKWPSLSLQEKVHLKEQAMDVGWSPPEEETNELIPIWNVERAHNETERKLRVRAILRNIRYRRKESLSHGSQICFVFIIHHMIFYAMSSRLTPGILI